MKWYALMTSLIFVAGAWAGAPAPSAQPQRPRVLEKVGIDQGLNVQVPRDLVFRDETGRRVELGDYFGQRPTILVFVYFNCPMLCPMTLSNLTRALNAMSLTAGKDFNVLTVSFDPNDTPTDAAREKATYLRRYRRPAAEAGWHFLTGDEASIHALTDAVGFHFTWDEKSQTFAHASGIIVLTPDGKTSRYFYGIEYAPTDLRLTLVDATGGAIATASDQVLLYCFHYDPSTGRYGLVISHVLQAGGTLVVLLLGGFIVMMIRTDHKQKETARRLADAPAENG
jgi:protein SCO1/2